MTLERTIAEILVGVGKEIFDSIRNRARRPKISTEIIEATVKEVIWQMNLRSIAAHKGGDIRLLEDITTRNGYDLILQKFRQNQELWQVRSIQDVVLKDIKWQNFELIDSNTARVKAYQPWDWICMDGQYVPDISDNLYVLKCLNGKWRVDYFEAKSIANRN